MQTSAVTLCMSHCTFFWHLHTCSLKSSLLFHSLTTFAGHPLWLPLVTSLASLTKPSCGEQSFLIKLIAGRIRAGSAAPTSQSVVVNGQLHQRGLLMAQKQLLWPAEMGSHGMGKQSGAAQTAHAEVATAPLLLTISCIPDKEEHAGIVLMGKSR